MRKKIHQMIGVATATALAAGLLITTPVIPVKALTNYQQGYDYEFDSMKVGDTGIMGLTNASDVTGYNESYVAKGEVADLDSDQLQKMITKEEFDKLNAEAMKYGKDSFVYGGETVLEVVEIKAEAEEGEEPGESTYYKVIKNPNITYQVNSKSTKVSATMNPDGTSATIKAVADTGDDYVTVEMIRTNKRTGKVLRTYKYIDVEGTEDTEEIKAEQITVPLMIGQSSQLSLSAVAGQNGVTYSFGTLSKKAKKIISLSSNGVVKGKKEGTALVKITATYTTGRDAGKSVKGVATINVKKAEVLRTSRKLEMIPGEQTRALVSYCGRNDNFTFRSGNQAVAKVTKQGIITAKKSGKTTVTVKSKKGKKKLASISVIVKKQVKEEFYLDTALYGTSKKGKDATSFGKNAIVTVPANTSFDMKQWIKLYTDKELKEVAFNFSTAGSTVATAGKSSGIIKTKHTGSTTITITSGSYKAKCKLYVVSGTKNKKQKAYTKASVAISKLANAKPIPSMKQAVKLYGEYQKAYAAYNQLKRVNGDYSKENPLEDGTKMDASQNNYLGIPNSSFLSIVEGYLTEYLDSTQASYHSSADFSPSAIVGTKGTVAFGEALRAVDVLAYCMDNHMVYQPGMAVKYNVTFDASCEKKIVIPTVDNAYNQYVYAKDGSFTRTEQHLYYPKDASGSYITKRSEYNSAVKQYQEKVTQNTAAYVNVGGMSENAEETMICGEMTRVAGSKTGDLLLYNKVLICNSYGNVVSSKTDENYLIDVAAHVASPLLSKDETTWVYGQSPNTVTGTLCIAGVGSKSAVYQSK